MNILNIPVIGKDEREVFDKSNPLVFTAKGVSNAISLNVVNNPEPISLKYKINDSDWVSYTIGEVIELDQNDTVAFSGANDHFSLDMGNYYNFKMSGTFEADGNIQSLMKFSNNCTHHCYYRLFKNCTSLVTPPPLLPATNLADFCYFDLFADCTALTATPTLPAKKLVFACYHTIFSGCTALTSAPLLPAPVLADECYNNMFLNCTSLTTPPSILSAPVLGLSCYISMFKGCTALTSTPIFGSTDLVECCYRNMFRGCTSLTTPPVLSATKLAPSCYFNMFAGCTNLTATPLLVATELADGCYANMFSGCTSLTNTSILPATTLPANCYNSMFSGCTALSSIDVEFTDWNDSLSSTYNWVLNVAPTGVFKKPDGLSAATGTSYIPEGWVIFNKVPLTFKSTGATSIGLTSYGTPDPIVLQYSKNGGAWTNWDFSAIELADGDTVAFSGANDHFSKSFYKNENNVWQYEHYNFVMNGTGTIAASGNVMSLMNFSNSCTTNCLLRLFYNCTILTDPPALPATKLAMYCYRGMFQNCYALTSVPQLPSTIIYGCYSYMFAGCSSLIYVPSDYLPALNVPGLTYYNMFYKCYSLTATPDLPASSVGQFGYTDMFANCSSLIKIPSILPTLELTKNCYNGMFANCRALTSAPLLPATELASSCYAYMFNFCSNLSSAPYLPAKTLAPRCYLGMFQNSHKISNINVAFTEWRDDLSATTNWVNNVAPTGTFTKPGSLTTLYSDSRIPTNWNILNVYGPLTFTAKAASNIALSSIGTPDAVDLNYKLNDGAWTAYSINTQIDLASGDTIAFSGNNDHFSKDINNYYQFKMTGTIEASDNIQSLMNYSKSVTSACYYGIFGGCSSLLTPPSLPATGLASECYWSMFEGCSSLSSAPLLPATTLADNCYNAMFVNCTSLSTAPDLPATTLTNGCYANMFVNCSKLSTAPLLPATELANNCYVFMFQNCISLTSAPVLPATTLAYGCYLYMFYGCSSLLSAPSLPATELANSCYYYMFQGCRSLTSAPSLSATTLANLCYRGMFSGCSSLYSIEVAFTNWTEATYATSDWVRNVAPTGIFYKPVTLSAVYGYNRIPTGWRVIDINPLTFTAKSASNAIALNSVGNPSAISLQYKLNNGLWTNYTVGTVIDLANGDTLALSGNNDHFSKNGSNYYNFAMTGSILADGNIQSLMNYSDSCTNNCYYQIFKDCSGLTKAPSLPATELAYNCYNGIFQGCTSLTSVPLLSATTLAEQCYANMFNGCTSLSTIPSLPATTLASGCYNSMFMGCTSISSVPLNYLSATTTAFKCYKNLFNGCTSLSAAPILSATVMTEECYCQMFQGCTSLSTAPLLSATTLATNCFSGMFSGCTNLNSISAKFTDWSDNLSATTNWVTNVAVTGTFYKPEGLSTEYGNSRIPTDWLIADVLIPLTFTAKSASNIALSTVGSPDTVTLQYSKNNGLWTNYTVGDVINLAADDKLAFSGNNDHFSKDYQNYYNFQMTGTVEASGNIQSLMNYSDSCTSNCYLDLFSGCTSLTKAPELPATTLADGCYNQMFLNCTNLTTAPSSLPATTPAMACYCEMFSGCTSLITAPHISATTIYERSCLAMFAGCSSLTTPPPIIPATSVGHMGCAYMFGGCYSLTAAPLLPATTLSGSQCYDSMFSGCTSLITPPSVILSVANKSCIGMFAGCSNLSTAPALPATNLATNCYESMFNGCTSLIAAPLLPATGLAKYCYSNMFYNCTSLTDAPLLPATTLAEGCYSHMFFVCSNLSSITVAFTDWTQATNATLSWANSVAASGIFYKPDNLSAIYGTHRIPNGWIVLAPPNPLTFTGKAASNAIALNQIGEPDSIELKYSKNNSIWTDYIIGNVIELASGDTLAFSGNNNTFTNSNGFWDYYRFAMTGSIEADGNIQSLTNYSDSITSTATFLNLFSGCTSLTKAPNLPATSLALNSYRSMFKDCTSLTSAPATLPATALNYDCYEDMFNGCTALTNAPTLPATTLCSYCYCSMFSGCTALTGAPQLPATTLDSLCYICMFSDCTSLTDAPQLPALVITNECYENMFDGCTSLTSAPLLPATELATHCYEEMFKGCTALSSAPQLPAITLTTQCYYGMFSGCTNLNSINVRFSNWNEGLSATTNWVVDVASAGVFTKPEGLSTVYGTSYIPEDWEIEEIVTNPLTFIAKNGAANIALNAVGKPNAITLDYQLNNGLWTTYTIGDIIELAEDDEISFSGTNNHFSKNNNYYQFAMTGTVETYGDIQSLMNWGNTCTDNCYLNLFNGCSSLITPPDLSATNIASGCYSHMFEGCTSLTAAPVLPATTVFKRSYLYMFSGCTSLTAAPLLPATTLAYSCYGYMFKDCTNLTTPSVLSATTLADWCYSHMFYSCSSLSAAPNLPAIELTEGCYYGMFAGCTGLVTPPLLPATTLTPSCYCKMFETCSSLLNAPALPATTLVDCCYRNLFYGCSSLTSITVPFTSWYENLSATQSWVQFVAASGIFTKPPTLSAEYGTSRIPNGWDIEREEDLTPGRFEFVNNDAASAGVKLITSGSPYSNSFKYNKNGTGWNDYTLNTLITLSAGEYVAFSGTGTQLNKSVYEKNQREGDFYNFQTSGTNLKIRGDITDLISNASMTSGCFSQLFKKNTLKHAKELALPNVTAPSCYCQMFSGCTKLKDAPLTLPAQVLSPNCYHSMFEECSSLIEAPSCLPAINLVYQCYRAMFMHCYSLSGDMNISGTNIASGSLRYMLAGNNNMTHIAVKFTDWSTANNNYDLNNWTQNITNVGTFVKPAALPATKNTSKAGHYIPINWAVEDLILVNYEPLTFTAKTAGNIALNKIGAPSAVNITYKVNDGNWIDYTIGDTINLAANDVLIISGYNNGFSKDSLNYYNFAMTGTVLASGNIMSLLNYGIKCTNACFTNLFKGCSGLVTPPLLPATTLANYCYYSMFIDCSHLSTTPLLPVTTLANYCYARMFSGCTNLSSAPLLPATTLAYQCYSNMFRGCTNLSSAPLLPATTLADNCYLSMFNGCTSLTAAPLLPAITLAQYCYAYMFKDCTSLTAAPYLPATQLQFCCYYEMFNGCSSLSSISVNFTNWGYTTDWVSGVAANGIFTKPYNLSTEFGTSKIPEGWTVEINQKTVPLTFTAKNGAANIALNNVGTIQGQDGVRTFEYSKNGGEWTSYTLNDVIDLDLNDTIAFSGNNTIISWNQGSYFRFAMTGTIEAEGNVQSLMNFSDTITNSKNYYALFSGCTSLVTPPELPATTLAYDCYTLMFAGCTSLSTAPLLPATTLDRYCYQHMFKDCTSLTSVPELPATTLVSGCYYGMFADCTSISSVPSNLLPATTLAKECYKTMFYGCAALTAAPLLPATTLANSCYQNMFWGCTSLSTAPLLPGTPDLWCYNQMFRGCTSLTTPPVLSATTLATGCYNSMFQNCTSLTAAPELSVTELANNCYGYMFNGCRSLTTPPSLPATTLAPSCYMWMFWDCKNLTSAPTLPATTLAEYCYFNMFRGCNALSTPLLLPATTLATGCYAWMFYDCTNLVTGPSISATTLTLSSCAFMFKACHSLTSISVAFTDWRDDLSATKHWVQDYGNGTGIFYKPLALSALYNDSRIPTNWTVLNVNYPLRFTGKGANNAVTLNTVGTPDAISLQYKKNNGLWTNYTNGEVIGLAYGDTVTLSGANDHFSKDLGNYYQFAMTGTILGAGNIQSLMDYSSACTDYCYNRMFMSCSGLTKTPYLPATELASGCYRQMFSGCKTITDAPTLPATTMAEQCYFGMFQGCTSLTSAPAIPATTLSSGCYYGMFDGCSNLSTAPLLPATELATYCYYAMFKGCTSLTDAPYLPATNLYSASYQMMFDGCSNLSSINVALTSWHGSYAASDWVKNVAATGIFYKPTALSAEYGVSRIPEGWTVMSIEPLRFTGKSASNAVQLSAVGLPDAISLKYKKNSGNWTTYNTGTIIDLANGDTLALSGANDHFSKDLGNYYQFAMTGTILADGNIQSLMNFSNSCTSACYYALFRECTSLVTPPLLPATELADGCYLNMFNSCAALTAAPELPALEAKLGCYEFMFANCTSLVQAPELPATTIAQEGYFSMFRGCTSLTSAPVLPATKLSLNCYKDMFNGCSSLSSINVAFTSWTEANATTNWVSGVAANGTFTKPIDLPLSTGVNYIPTGWTVTNK